MIMIVYDEHARACTMCWATPLNDVTVIQSPRCWPQVWPRGAPPRPAQQHGHRRRQTRDLSKISIFISLWVVLTSRELVLFGPCDSNRFEYYSIRQRNMFDLLRFGRISRPKNVILSCYLLFPGMLLSGYDREQQQGGLYIQYLQFY